MASKVTDEDIEAAKAQVEQLRDAGRPDLATVAACLDRAIAEMGAVFGPEVFQRIAAGPDYWEWRDSSLGEHAVRHYSLSRSVAQDVEGYPLITIRQLYSSRLDTWVTLSGLVQGPEPEVIFLVLSILVSAHQGAMAGFKSVMRAVARDEGAGDAAYLESKRLMDEAEREIPGMTLSGYARDPDSSGMN
jgi:hypothetical protein